MHVAWAEITLKDGFKYILACDDWPDELITWELNKYLEWPETDDIKIWLR